MSQEIIPAQPESAIITDSLLTSILDKDSSLAAFLERETISRNIQFIYTAINRDANNTPELTDHLYNPSTHYFYPASTVKLPTALLALQKINELSIPQLTKESEMITDAAYAGQSWALNDPQSPDGTPSIALYIKKILLVSDNDAFNRLYEFCGQQYINEELHKRGYDSTEIIHRLEISLSEDENRHTNPVSFYDPAGSLLYLQQPQFNKTSFPKRNDFLGEAHYRGGKLMSTPMDFSLKNRLPLKDLHGILRSVIFPEQVSSGRCFNLTDDDYNFLYRYMSAKPSESDYPSYNQADYWDAYVKFLLFGSEKTTLPKHLRIFNKVGDAYGQLIDAAYIVDFENNVEFFLSAIINCNSNGILNDDKYDYESVGFPFLKQLGEVFSNYERRRPRAVTPDLSRFRMDYSTFK